MLRFLAALLLVTVVMTDVRAADTIVCAPGEVAENATGRQAGILSGHVHGETSGLSFTVLSPDDAVWEVVGSTLQMRSTAPAFDHETTPSRSVRIQATNLAGDTTDKDVAVQVLDRPEAPTDMTLSSATVDENSAGAAVGTLGAVDPDAGETFTFSVPAVGSPFTVSGTTLKLKDGVSLNRETLAGGHAMVTVRVADSDGLVYDEAFTITVNDRNEAPTDIILSSASVTENSVAAVVGTLSGSDPDAGSTLTFSVPDGSSPFTVSGTNLRLKDGRSLDYEALTGGHATVTVRVSDGALTYDEAFSITVLDVNEAPNDITFTPAPLAENLVGMVVVGTLGATDPDAGATFTFSIPAAASRFTVSGTSLRLKVGASFDYEALAGGVATVTVRATDQHGISTDKVLTIPVEDLNEAPTGLQVDSCTVEESTFASPTPGAAVDLLTLQGIDPDVGRADFRNLGYALDPSSGTQVTALFAVVGNKLQRRAGADLDTESTPSYIVRVRVFDVGEEELSLTIPVTVTVADRNDALRIDGWESGQAALTDPGQPLPVAADLVFTDQDIANSFRIYNGMKIRFRLASPDVADPTRLIDVDDAEHALRFDLPPGTALTATEVSLRTTEIRRDGTLIAVVQPESASNQAIWQFMLAGDHASATPLATVSDLSVLLNGLSYRTGLVSTRDVPDLVLECSTERPWQGSQREWSGLRTIRVSTANRPPALVLMGGDPALTVERDRLIEMNEVLYAVRDDYPENGARLLIAYPPLFGELLDGESNPLAIDPATELPYLPIVYDPLEERMRYILRYRPFSSSASDRDQFIVEVRDNGILADSEGDGERTSQLTVIPVRITPGSIPSLSPVVTAEVIHTEGGAAIKLAPEAIVSVSDGLPLLAGWTLYAGPAGSSPLFEQAGSTFAFDAEIARVKDDGSDTVEVKDGDAWRAVGVLSKTDNRTWDGEGRTLAIRLDDETTPELAARLAQGITFAVTGDRIPVSPTERTLAMGFLATADPSKSTDSRPVLRVVGINDPPRFTALDLELRTTGAGTILGVSEVIDPDGNTQRRHAGDPPEAERWDCVPVATDSEEKVEVLAASTSNAPGGGPTTYRIVWSMTPSLSSASAQLAFIDSAGFQVVQDITVSRLGSNPGGMAFVSDPPLVQEERTSVLTPLVLADGSGILGSDQAVDFFLAIPPEADPNLLARIIQPIPSTRQLQIDLRISGAPAHGSLVTCVLVATRTTASAVHIAELPLMLKVVPVTTLAAGGAN